MSVRSIKLGNHIREWRIRRGLSQSQLAAACGISQYSISSIERGVYSPSAYHAFCLCGALDAEFESLFFLLDENGNDPRYCVAIWFIDGHVDHYHGVSWVTDLYDEDFPLPYIVLSFSNGDPGIVVSVFDIDFLECGSCVNNVSSVGIKGGKS